MVVGVGLRTNGRSRHRPLAAWDSEAVTAIPHEDHEASRFRIDIREIAVAKPASGMSPHDPTRQRVGYESQPIPLLGRRLIRVRCTTPTDSPERACLA
jgi:hypothetical protein